MNPDPIPYQPPMQQFYGYAPPPDLGKYARRASVMMFVLGAMTMLMGACIMGATSVIPRDQWPPELTPQIEKLEADTGVSIKSFFLVAGGVIATPGLIMIVLGFFVRRGGIVSAVLGLMLTGLMLLYFAATVLQALMLGMKGNVAGAFFPLVFGAVATALFGLQLYWLSRAVVNAGPLKVFNQHQQAYLWQMQQQSQAQQQQYRMPPPPPPGVG